MDIGCLYRDGNILSFSVMFNISWCPGISLTTYSKIMDLFHTVSKIWQISVGKEEEVLCRENFPVILGN
jgi:hypothetical protein